MIENYPFDREQREQIFRGLIKLDRENKLRWIHGHMNMFALRPLDQLPKWAPKQAVPPHILILGEGPGELEDNTGKPFWGPAGRAWDCVIEEVYSTFFFTMTNTVCCRPTKTEIYYEQPKRVNRPPTEQEQTACLPHLQELVSSYHFDGILALGGVADKNVANNFYTLPRLAVKHPSWILRQNYRVKHNREIALQIDEWIQTL